MLYADYNATSPLPTSVSRKMLPFLQEEYGNPSSTFHGLGSRARAAVEEARVQVAELLGANPEQVVFTSGGTESCVQALVGGARRRSSGCRLIRSSVEHSAVGEAIRFLQEFRGCKVSLVPVAASGALVKERLLQECADCREPIVSIMAANNETGIRFPVAELVAAVKSHNVLFHSDAVQLAGKAEIAFRQWGLDLMSISAHKFGGPKGIGALLLKEDIEWEPMIKGGGQESGRRGGTEAVASIVGMGEAARLCREQLQSGRREEIAFIRNKFEELLESLVPDIKINGKDQPRLDNTSSVLIRGVSSKELRDRLAKQGCIIAAGSACSASQLKPSAVLQAMGQSVFDAVSTIRVSFGIDSTIAEAEQLVGVLREEVQELRTAADSLIEERLETQNES